MIDKTDAQVIEQYLKIRTHIAALKEKHKVELTPYTEGLDMLEGVMAGRLIERGANNVQTPAGTAYRTTLIRPTVSDRGLFLAHVRMTENWDLMEIKCSLDPLKQFMEDNNKSLPPGIDVTTILNTNFRKA